jgi:hypothetical protein
MFPPPRPTVALLALALAGPAAAATRIAIAPVQGDPRGDVGAQLVGALCGVRRCLPGALASGARPELARARRLGAEGALVGSLWRERDGRVLSLALFTAGRAPARTWVLRLGPDGLVEPGELERLGAGLDAALGLAPSAPPLTPAPAPAPAADARLPPGAPAASLGPVLRADEGLAGLPRTAPLDRSAPVRPAPRPAETAPWLIVEAGVEPAHRALRFPAAGTAPVGYAVDLAAPPRLALEGFPLRAAGGRGAGLGLFADATYQAGIALPAGTRTHAATLLRLRGGLRWRLRLAGGLVLVPALAYERESFTVGTAAGVRLPGLPDTRLSGGSAALGLELPLAGSRLALLAGGRATWWLEARELAGGASFFPGGRASSLEGEAGAAVALAGSLSLRALGHYAVTRWSLDVDPSGAYTVRSARGETWGGRVTLRLEL